MGCRSPCREPGLLFEHADRLADRDGRFVVSRPGERLAASDADIRVDAYSRRREHGLREAHPFEDAAEVLNLVHGQIEESNAATGTP